MNNYKKGFAQIIFIAVGILVLVVAGGVAAVVLKKNNSSLETFTNEKFSYQFQYDPEKVILSNLDNPDVSNHNMVDITAKDNSDYAYIFVNQYNFDEPIGPDFNFKITPRRVVDEIIAARIGEPVSFYNENFYARKIGELEIEGADSKASVVEVRVLESYSESGKNDIQDTFAVFVREGLIYRIGTYPHKKSPQLYNSILSTFKLTEI